MSSLLVGLPQTTLTTDPGYSLYVQGAMKNLGNLDVEGTVSATGNISTGSNLYVLGAISTLGNFGARGDIMTIGNIIAPNGSVITSNLDVRGQTSIGGPVTFSNSVVIGTSLSVQNSITASNYITTSVQVASSINLQEKSISYRTYDLLFSDAITVPGVSTNNLTASNGITTSNLTVYATIQAQQTPALLLSSTVITNPAGSLTISSISGNNATFSNAVSTSQLQTSSIITSSILLSGNIYAAASGYLNINSVIASTISTGILYSDTVEAINFTTTTLGLSKLTVASEFIADNVSTFSLSNVMIDNTGGSISTGTLYVQNLLATSSITNTSGQFYTTSGNIRFVASTVIMDSATISTLTTSSIVCSSLTTSQITIGAIPSANNGPYFTVDNTLFPSTNVITTGGPGDYLTPFFVSNVQPPGTLPGTPYTVNESFALNFNGPPLPGYFATILGFNLYPNGESNCQISIRTLNDSNTITTLYGLYGTNQSYSTPPNTGGIAIPYGALPASFIHITGTMYGNSAFSLQFQSRFNDNYVGIDSNNTVTINNGVIRWPYFLNGTTIQNSLNDMSVRSLYYYGALNFASDPALKENIRDADLSMCYTAVEAIPLRRFKYIDPYMSTFQQKDTHRLGFIATELETIFPKSITYTYMTDIPGYQSTFRMIDTQQIEMAHIGATKVLMNKVSNLYTTLEEARQDISTMKNLLNL
jgi:cytoskeletal protein CcmA (bactofilin family)